MAPLRQIHRGSRFPQSTETHFDDLAYQALSAVLSEDDKQRLDGVKSNWHRPSGGSDLLEANIEPFGHDLPSRYLGGEYLAILKKTIDELRPSEPLIPLTLGAAMKHSQMPKTTSPGFPWVNQGYSSKGDVFNCPRGRGHIHRTWDSIGRGIPWSLPDSLAFQRVVASRKEKTKVRPVWGLPTEVITEEARFFIPLLEHLKPHCNERDSFYGLGLESGLSGHRHIARSADSPRCNVILNTDFSNFDAHVTSWLIRDIFSHLSSFFDFTRVVDSEGLVWPVKPEQTCRRWKALISYFINTKIRLPSGKRFQKFQGVPSGTMFTNLIDTIANAVMTRTTMYRCTGELPQKDFYYGDDSTIWLKESLDLDEYARVLRDIFGGIVSVDKTLLTSNTNNIHWLGYYHRPTGPQRDLDFIFASTLYPEKEIQGPIDTCARLLGQLFSTLDPVSSVIFWDAVVWIQRHSLISDSDLNEYVSNLPSKAMKFLQTLGYEVSDVVKPYCTVDPFGKRRIDAVMPKPCARNYFRLRDQHLPRFAFAPEAYQNKYLRTDCFNDFDLYKETFCTNNQDFSEDEGYFTT